MKNKILALLVIMILAAMQPAFAAFPVKHAATTEKARTVNTLNTPVTNNAYEKAAHFTDRVSRALHIHNPLTPDHKSSTGVLGLLSLIFGILGILTIAYGGTLFSIAAIVLGAVGRKHKEQFSLTGLILGIVGVALVILVALFIIALLGAFIF